MQKIGKTLNNIYPTAQSEPTIAFAAPRHETPLIVQ